MYNRRGPTTCWRQPVRPCFRLPCRPAAPGWPLLPPARDTWVRLRGGLYKDDLARVVDVDPVGGRATIKVLHRLDFAALANRVGGKRTNLR